MSDQLFDKHIKEQLENFASPVPKGMWDKIVVEQKRRPTIFWWNSKPFLVFSLLVTISTFGVFMLYHQHKVETAQSLVTKAQPLVALIHAQETNNTIVANSSSKIEHLEPEKLTTAQANSTKQNNSSNNSSVVNKKEELNSNVFSTKILATTYSTIRTLKNNSNSNTNNLQTAVQSNYEQNNEAYVFHASKANVVTIEKKQPLLKNIFYTTHQSFIKDPIGCPEDKSGNRNDWYVETYLAPEFTFKKVSGNSDNMLYLNKKDSAESMRGGFTFGARISKNITNNILIKAGVQFSQLNEVVKLRRENERRMVTVVTIRTVTDALGNTTTVADTSTITQIGYVESTAKNYYRNIELPVALSYEFGNKNFKAAINGGVIMNLSSWYSGRVLDTSYQLVNVHPKENDGITKHNIALSLYGSVSLIKPIKNNMDVFAEPYFRYSLSKLQNTAYNFNQRFSAAGISLGIRYKLN